MLKPGVSTRVHLTASRLHLLGIVDRDSKIRKITVLLHAIVRCLVQSVISLSLMKIYSFSFELHATVTKRMNKE